MTITVKERFTKKRIFFDDKTKKFYFLVNGKRVYLDNRSRKPQAVDK